MAANQDKQALLLRSAYESAWKGDTKQACDALVDGKKSDNLWLSMGYSQIIFAVAMGTGKQEDIEVARESLYRVEKLAEAQKDANEPEGMLSSMWKSFSLWDGGNAAGGSSPDARGRTWRFLAALVCLAEVNLNLLALYVKDRQWVSLGLSARRSWKLYEESLEVFKQMKEANYIAKEGLEKSIEEQDILSRLQFGVGLYHFMVSLVPPGLLMVVEAIGFQANRDHGISLLKECVDKRGIHYTTSAIMLVAYHNFFMQQDEPANKILEQLIEGGYKTAPAVRLMAGTVARRQGQIARAVESYQLGISGVKDQPQVILTLEAELGNTYFLDGQWEKAAELLQRFISNTTNRQYRCFSAWKLGICQWMIGKQANADKVAELNKQVVELADERFAYEKFSKRIAQRYLKAKRYTEFETLWFHAWCWNQASRFQESSEILGKATEVVKAQKDLPIPMVECVALCLYLKMSNYNGMVKLQDASESLKKLLKIQNEIVDELWVVPHAYVEMGELYLKRAANVGAGEDATQLYNKAAICFERAKSFSDYDFERPLSFRMVRGQDLLRRANIVS